MAKIKWLFFIQIKKGLVSVGPGLKLGFEVLLANPVKVKLRPEDIKNDKVDSKTLAELVRMNWLPTCYVPPAELRWLRNLLRHRNHAGFLVMT